MKNAENVDSKKQEIWKTELMEVSKNLSKALAADESSKIVANEYLQQTGEDSNSGKVSTGTITKNLKDNLAKRVASGNPDNSQLCKKIKDMVYPEHRGDDDIMVEAEETEMDYKCPISSQRYAKPMKRYHRLTLFWLAFEYLTNVSSQH